MFVHQHRRTLSRSYRHLNNLHAENWTICRGLQADRLLSSISPYIGTKFWIPSQEIAIKPRKIKTFLKAGFWLTVFLAVHWSLPLIERSSKLIENKVWRRNGTVNLRLRLGDLTQFDCFCVDMLALTLMHYIINQ